MPTQLSRTGPTMHRHRAAATHRALAFLARAQAHDRRCLLLDHNCVVDYLLGSRLHTTSPSPPSPSPPRPSPSPPSPSAPPCAFPLFTSHNSFAPAAGTPEFKVQDSDINTGDDD